MKPGLKRLALVTGISIALSGCGMFSSETPVDAPSPLVEFEAEQSLVELWSVDVGGDLGELYHQFRPSISDGRIFATSAEGDLVAADVDSGEVIWRQELDTDVIGGVGAGNGLVLFSTLEGEVIALSADDGSERWRFQAGSEVTAQPQMNAELVVIQQLDGKLIALDVDTGEKRWSYDSQIPRLSLRGTSAPIVAADLTLAAFANGKMVAVDNANGRQVWEQRISLAEGRSELERIVDIDAQPLVYNRLVYTASYQGRLAAISPGNGQIVWARDLSSYRGLAGGFGNIYAVTDNSSVQAFDARSNASVWQQDDLLHRGLTSPVALGNSILVGDSEGYLHALSQVDGHLTARYRVDSSGLQGDLLARDDVLYALSNDGRLVALKLQ